MSELGFGSIPRQPRLSEAVRDRIADIIVAQNLEPGDALPSESQLAAQFNVSKAVVREALREVVAGHGVRQAREQRVSIGAGRLDHKGHDARLRQVAVHAFGGDGLL